MKAKLNSIFKFNMEPELIEIDCYGMGFGIFHHFFIPPNPIEKTSDFLGSENNLTVITVRNPIICYKERQI